MFMFDKERHLATAFPIGCTPRVRKMTGDRRAAAAPHTGTITDRFGFSHVSRSQAAIATFERAVFGVAAHRPSTAADLAAVVEADPGLVAAHALKGFAQLILARQETSVLAWQALHSAETALTEHGGGTADELALVEALRHAAHGYFGRAAARLDAHVASWPSAFLPIKLAHALRFMVGDVSGMLAMTARVLDAGSTATAGFGFLLGCHAFSLEETGQYELAERIGRRAVELEPEDAWGLQRSVTFTRCRAASARASPGLSARAPCGAAATTSRSIWPGTSLCSISNSATMTMR
jgi:hypothetical protein